MKRLVLFLLLLPILVKGQIQLSNEAQIHVLTCGPYQGEVYSAFGHSAIRVYDPAQGVDLLYNYGIFDFDQPNFYLNFARGYLNYKLGVTTYDRFRNYYVYYNRFINEQVLNLDSVQKQKYFDFLQWNAKPENQFYYYDYFYDNCATRVRDGLITTFRDDIQFDGSYVTTDYTIRDLTDLYLDQQPWGDLGIDLGLGLPMDKKATPSMYMFLPDYIEQAFNHATIKQDGKEVPLVKQTIQTYKSKPEPHQGSLITPWMVFWIIFTIMAIVTFFGFKKGKHSKLIDVVLFSIIGLLGWLLFLLWVATDHGAAARNMNLLWAIPLHFPLGLFILKKKIPAYLPKYFQGIFILEVLLLLTWAFLPQDLHNSLIPITAMLGMRAWFVSNNLKKKV